MFRCRKTRGFMPRKLFFIICATTAFVVTIEIFHNYRLTTGLRSSSNIPIKTTTANRIQRLHLNHLAPSDEPQQRHVISVELMKDEYNKAKILQKSRIQAHDRIAPGYTIRSVQDVVNQDGSAELQKVVFPNVYKNDSLAMQRYINYLQTREEPLPLQTKAVIILTNYRSGSSFFGELLNQHPDVFYMFEPLILLSKLDHCHTNSELKKNILKDLFQCKLPDWFKVYSNLPHTLRPPMTKNIFTCIRKKSCFSPFTKDLTKEKHCPRAVINVTRPFNAWDHCGAINPNLAVNDCRKKQLVAIKVIRFCNLADLQDVVSSIETDVKVIHLIRDPRGIAHSRHVIHRRMNLAESMRFTCRRQRDNAELAFFERPEWLHGRYKMFRYEDAALRPFEVAQDLFKFVGLEFPEEVKNWIVENTKQPLPSFMRPTSSEDEQEDEEGMRKLSIREQQLIRIRSNRDPWGHSRNSKMIVQKWRYRMPYSVTRSVEEVCSDIMEIAGYLPIDKQLYANISHRFFLDHLPVH